MKKLKSRNRQIFDKWLTQAIYFVVATVFCFIPLWIFLATFHALGPQTFWEKLAMLGLGFVIGGAIQMFLFLLWLYALIHILDMGSNIPSKRLWAEQQKRFLEDQKRGY